MSAAHATPTDAARAGDALASAFSDDPLFAWLLGSNGPHEARLRPFFRSMLKRNVRVDDHLVFVADDGSGAAIWRPVDRWKVPPADLIRGLPVLARTFRARLPAVGRAFAAIEKAHPTEPHYYLEALGTRADQQSKGVGSSVLSVMLERCDTEGVPAYLESSNRRNVPFYARHGFVERGPISCGSGAPELTAMWREPRS